MSTDAAKLSPADHTRHARSAFVRETLKSERWSIRQAALALGMSHTALASRLRSETLFLADEIEGIAHLLRVSPVAYYGAYLAAGTEKAPTPEGEGLKLPGLDSNQEPIGSQHIGSLIAFPARPDATTDATDHTAAPVIDLTARRGA